MTRRGPGRCRRRRRWHHRDRYPQHRRCRRPGRRPTPGLRRSHRRGHRPPPRRGAPAPPRLGRAHDVVHPTDRERGLITGHQRAMTQFGSVPTVFRQRTAEDGERADGARVIVQLGVPVRRPADQPHIDLVVGQQAGGPAFLGRPAAVGGQQVVVAAGQHILGAFVGQPEQVGRAQPGGQGGGDRTGRQRIRGTSAQRAGITCGRKGKNRRTHERISRRYATVEDLANASNGRGRSASTTLLGAHAEIHVDECSRRIDARPMTCPTVDAHARRLR